MDDLARCRACARRVPWASFWGNLGVAIYKLVVGLLGGSAALVADALHSFADVVGSTGIVLSTRISARDPDDAYPYGRGKAEFIGAVFIYVLLLVFATVIIAGAIRSLVVGETSPPHFVTILGAVVSVLYNGMMYRFATCAGMRTKSPAILADAFENRADAISSVACIVGIGGAMVIHPACDPLAAMAVGVIIMWNCQQQLREAARGLMDNGLGEQQIEFIKRTASRHEDVEGVAYVRTRQTGARHWIDLGIYVSADLDVATSDEIAEEVRDMLVGRPEYHHIEIFVLPGDVAVDAPVNMPRRAASLQQVR